jgi:hypothetical protein
MDLQETLDGYLGTARENVPGLELYNRRQEMLGNLPGRIARREGERDQLAALGPTVILPMLHAATVKISKTAKAGPNLIIDEGFVVGYIQSVIANTEEVVARIGNSAIPDLLAALQDPMPVVRSLAAACLALLEPAKRDTAVLEEIFEREGGPVARIVLGGALLYFARMSSKNSLSKARKEVTDWADKNRPDWRPLVRNQGIDQDRGLGLVVVASCLDALVYSQARAST